MHNCWATRKAASLLNVFGMGSSADHRPTFLPASHAIHIRPSRDFPDLDGGERERSAHLTRAPLDLQRVPNPRRRHEGGVNIRRQAGGGRPRRLDGQAAGPVRQTGRHGAMQGALGVQMHGRDLQQGDDVPG